MPRLLLVAVGGQQPVLRQRDLGEHLGGRGLPVVGERLLDLPALLIGEQPFDHAPHVRLVVHGVVLGAAEHAGVLAQHPRADRVKRRGGDAARDLLAEQVGEPQPQLARRAHREGDGQDFPRLRGAGLQQPGDPVDQRLGLAGARAGDQQQGSGAVADGLRLLGGQALEQRVLARPGGSGVGTRDRVRHLSPPVAIGLCDERGRPVSGGARLCAGLALAS